MTTDFEWDREKETKNIRKHGVAFDEAQTIFDDPFFLSIDDPIHAVGETRFLAIGYSMHQRLLAVVYTERGNATRIINARMVTNWERSIYEQGN
ncbi:MULTISPECIES: BrnT family toxin [Kamptonema]|uniref:BrnT family toxin n=1 Tax=Kamptonema TaxID=1501433 RepID=UPI0001DAD308|nr:MULTISPECIES: BrnT family toxin [Kamptonema]CBN54688.1 conserved hypothetical protein [Kamptonema sp. PCC 6506]